MGDFLREFGARDRNLLSGSQIFESEDVGLYFVFTDNQREGCAGFGCGFEGFLETKGFIAQFDDDIVLVAAEFSRQASSFERRRRRCWRRSPIP